MSEYLTGPTNTTNPVMNPRLYWIVSGYALAAVAILGIVVNIFAGNMAGLTGFLEFDWTHNIVHVLLAAVAFYFGYANQNAGLAKTMAIVFGFVYAGLGVLGLFAGDALSFIGLHMELGENLVHLLLGAWALTAGFGAEY